LKWYGAYIRLLKNDSTDPGIMTDIDGNSYATVKIGSQVWMASNLKVTKCNDGTPIPNVTDNTAWAALTTPAYCFYNNIEPIPEVTGKIVRIEEIQHVFSNDIFLTIEDATEMTEESAADLTFSSLSMGFQKSELYYNALKGRYEYNTTVKYSTPLTRQQKEMSAISPYRADTNGILGCFTKPKVGGASENTTFDADNFLVNVVRSEGGFQIARDDNYSSVGGVENPSNAFNLDYQPARNLRRWGSYLRGFLDKYTSLLLSFIVNTNNSNAYSQRNDETEVITEGQDVNISNLNSPFYENLYYTFNCKVTTDMITAMNSYDVDGVPLYYGLIKFRNNPNEDYRYGWLMTFNSRKPDNKGLGTFKLLKSVHSLSLAIDNYSDCTAQGANDGSVTLLATGGTSPYAYRIGSGTYQSSETFNSLAPGTYTFTVKDSTGSTNTISQVIKEPSVSKSVNITVSYLADQSGSSNITVYPLTLETTAILVDSGDGTSWASIIAGASATGNFTLTVKSLSQNNSITRGCLVRISSAYTNDVDVSFMQLTNPVVFTLNTNLFVNVDFDSFSDSSHDVTWGNTTPYKSSKARNQLAITLTTSKQVKIIITNFSGNDIDVKLVTSVYADASSPVVITGNGTYILTASVPDVKYVQIYNNNMLTISGSFTYEIYYQS
jgi:hypothetical protein